MEPKLVILIFVSGKIVITGAKEQKDAEQGFLKIIPVLENAKKLKFQTYENFN